VGGTTYLDVVASGGTGALSYTYTGLPDGCAPSDTDNLACVPSESGTFDVRVFVNDTLDRSATTTLTLSVEPASSPTSQSSVPLSTLIAVMVAVLAIVAILVAVAILSRRRPPSDQGPPPA
jgi:hypothetical protein